MTDAASSAMSVATLANAALHSSAGRRDRPMRSASAFNHGVDPIAPAASASHTSGFRNHWTVYGVGAATPNPVIAFRYPTAPASVSARKKTQPTITTSIV